MIDLMIGNFLTLITEFIAIRAGLGFFGIPPWAAVLSTLVVLYVALMTHRYWTWERITLAAAMCNLIFVPAALLAHPKWDSIGHALVYWSPLPGGVNKDMMLDFTGRHWRHGYSLDAFSSRARRRIRD